MNKNKELLLEEINKKRNYLKWINIVTAVLITSRIIEVIAWFLLKSPNIVSIIIGNTFFTLGLSTYTIVETTKTIKQIKILVQQKEQSSNHIKIKQTSKNQQQNKTPKSYDYINNNSNANIEQMRSKKKIKKLNK